MKSQFLSTILLSLFLMPATVFGQIYEPEGVNIPGEWNGFTNSNDPEVMGNFRMIQRDFGGSQYITTLNIAESGGDATGGTFNMLFTSGPDGSPYSNKWVDATLNIDGFSDLNYQGSVDNSITVENGFYYTILFKDNGYQNSSTAVFKTSAEPVLIDTALGIPGDFVPENDPVTISVELNKAKSPEEKIYIRYSTDNFQTSDAVEITNFAGGTTGTADIPGQPKNTSVNFYVLSTTMDKAAWDGKPDLATIDFQNNGGSNYRYFYEPNIVPVNGSEGISFLPELTWYTVDHLAGYDLQLDDNSDFSSPVVNETDIADTTYTLTTELDVYTNYYWRFKTDTASAWSETFTFRTRSAITFANVQFPESAVVDEGGLATIYGQVFVPGVTLLAGESGDISAWIGLNESNSNPESWAELSWSAANYNATSTTAGDNDEYEAVVGSDLSPGTYYYAYRYQYQSQDLVFGVLGGIWDDTTQTLGELVILDVPELNSPANNSVDTALEPELSWATEDGNIAHYNLQVSEASDFSSFVIDETGLSAASTNYTVGAGVLNYETTYFWRVSAGYDTTESGWSDTFSFTTIQDVPGKIVLTSPTDLEENVSLVAVFEWNEDTGASSYELQVSEDNTFTDAGQTAIDETGLTATSYTVETQDSLKKSATYYWRVRGVNATGSGEWSEAFSFSTIGNPPAKIVLSQPADEAQHISVQPVFEWQADSDVESYVLQVSAEPDFNTPELLAIDESGITEATYAVTPGQELNTAEQYYWRVQGINSAGNGTWSDTLSFSTTVPVPQLKEPEDEGLSVPVNPVLTWFPVQDAQHYEVQLATGSNFTDLLVDTASVSDTSLAVNGLDFGSTYYWRVRVQVNGLKSDWSTSHSFTVKSTPPAFPVLISPDSGAVNVSLDPVLVWEASQNAVSYEIQAATQQNFESGLVLDTTGYAGTELTLHNLEPNTSYFWRVRALNGEGSTGQWSTTGQFTTIPNAPDAVTLLTPADSLSGLAVPVNFTWEPSQGAESYEFQFSTSPSFSFTFDSTLSGTALTLEDFNSGSGYFWRVRASNGGGVSEWSAPRYFETGVGGFAGPELITPENEAVDTGTEVEFEWTEMAGAQSYQLQVAESGEFNTLAEDTAGVEETSFTVTGLENGNTYFWRVRGLDAQSESEWSSVFSFSTQIPVPGTAVPLSPADSTADVNLPVTFTWKPAAGASSYNFRLSGKENFSVSIDSSVTDTSLTLSTLTHNSPYYWQVRAKNTAGNSAWSAVQYFTTNIALPGIPELVNPEDGEEIQLSVRFGWNEAANAESYTLQISKEENFETTVIDTASITGLTFQLDGLEEAATYYWRVRGVNRAGEGEWPEAFSFITETLTSLETDAVPTEFALYPNYPNPFNPSTTIRYDVKHAGEVKIQVYDISGRLIQTLVDERKNTGRYQATFDAGALASGLYLLRMNAPGFVQIRKMTLVK